MSVYSKCLAKSYIALLHLLNYSMAFQIHEVLCHVTPVCNDISKAENHFPTSETTHIYVFQSLWKESTNTDAFEVSGSIKNHSGKKEKVKLREVFFFNCGHL